MSDHPVTIPSAAVDISRYRAAAERALTGDRMPRLAAAGIALAAALVVATVIAAAAVGGNGEIGGAGGRTVIAVGIVIVLLVTATLVMIPLRKAAEHRRARVAAATSALDSTAAAVAAHLASIGYAVPVDSAVEWLRSPEPTATVPLVHDSVIAARWWRPGKDDDRVFLEPYLRQHDIDSTLPVLPPL